MNIPEKLHCISSKRQKRQTLIASISVKTIPIPTHSEEQHLPFKQTSTTTIFSLDPNPVFGHSLVHSFAKTRSDCNSGINLVVALEYTFFQHCSYAEQVSVRLARFRRSYVKRPPVVLTSHTSYTAFSLDVRCAVQSGSVPFLQLFVLYDSVFS